MNTENAKMDDVDMISIYPSQFRAHHAQMLHDACAPDAKLEKKLSVFLDTYKNTFDAQNQLCIMTPSLPHPPPHPGRGGGASHQVHFGNRNTYHKTSFKSRYHTDRPKNVGGGAHHWNESKKTNVPKTTSVSTEQRRKIGLGNESQRFILSALNKVSPGNCKKLKQVLLDYCMEHEDRVEVCVRELIKKCASDMHFAILYIDILKDIMAQYRDIVYASVAQFIGDFIFSLPSRLMQLFQSICHENNLTHFLRLKKDMYNDNKSICLLLVQRCTCVDSDQYLCHLKRVFDQVEMNSEIFDIFIHFVYDFFMYHVTLTMSPDAKSFIRVLFEQKDGDCNKCTAFKLEDLFRFFEKNNTTHLLEI